VKHAPKKWKDFHRGWKGMEKGTQEDSDFEGHSIAMLDPVG